MQFYIYKININIKINIMIFRDKNIINDIN